MNAWKFCPTCGTPISEVIRHPAPGVTEHSWQFGDPERHKGCLVALFGEPEPLRIGNAGGRSRPDVERILREEFGQR